MQSWFAGSPAGRVSSLVYYSASMAGPVRDRASAEITHPARVRRQLSEDSFFTYPRVNYCLAPVRDYVLTICA